MGDLHETWMLPRDPSAAGLARRRVTDVCREHSPEALSSLQLIVSELVSNALKHGLGPVRLCLDSVGGRIRLEVQDDSSCIPRQRDLDLLSEHGRGMLIVAALADSWGVRPAGSGKSVWCELDTRN